MICCGDGSDGYGFGEGVLPEIAHEAAPGALAIGEEEGGYGDDFFCGGVLLFYEEGVGAVGVELVALRTVGEDPLVAVGAIFRIRRRRAHW